MADSPETKLFSYPAAPTELATQITKRIQNILHSPITMRYEVTYKLYRKQLERLATVHFTSSQKLFCFAGAEIYEVGTEFEDLLNKAKLWTLRQTMKVAGSVHEIGGSSVAAGQSSTRVSVGIITQGPSSKGLLLEICRPDQNSTMPQVQTKDQILSEIMGPIHETLLTTAKKSPMLVSAGVELTSTTMLLPGRIQAAAAYFELFSKL